MLLGGLAALVLATSCRDSAKQKPQPPIAAKGPEVPVPPPSPSPPPSEGSVAKPVGDEPPELAAIRERVVQGDRSKRTLKELQKLSRNHPKNAEVAYILGQFYCGKLWMGDCLENFHRALQLEPSLRTNPYLIKAAVAGLGSDGEHTRVRRFLIKDIGQPAAPFLEDVLKGTWRQQVKDRASAILREIK
jgi:hypothetical protein